MHWEHWLSWEHWGEQESPLDSRRPHWPASQRNGTNEGLIHWHTQTEDVAFQWYILHCISLGKSIKASKIIVKQLIEDSLILALDCYIQIPLVQSIHTSVLALHRATRPRNRSYTSPARGTGKNFMGSLWNATPRVSIKFKQLKANATEYEHSVHKLLTRWKYLHLLFHENDVDNIFLHSEP